MRLKETPAEQAFRAELRAWLDATLAGLPDPPPFEDWAAKRAYDTGWQRRLHDAGYAGISWPKEYGGRGATPSEELIFLEESERAGAPYVGCNFVSTLHAGPTIAAEGTPEQRARYLPPILRGDNVWCQGFSEPEAGSDLASLRTRAVRDGDHYVVTGQKIWTSHAQVADYCELLARTDPDAPKHRGITWMIMPMDSPGIEVRPMRTLTGESEFSEMFLDEVRIPVGNVVGAENDGWRVAMVTFGFERGTAFVSELLGSMRLLADLVDIARKTPLGAGTAWDDASIRRPLTVVGAELEAEWALTKRNVSRAARHGNAGVGGSVFKLAYHETRERMGEVALRLLGRARLAFDDPTGLSARHLDHVGQTLYALSLSIAAGTAQIQRNIVGERLLGLPKDPYRSAPADRKKPAAGADLYGGR
ncbi:MAG TPA: acyl-CoA dehydrogenase family protein [Acidimicrobiales bacterium]|nr:acyl-CoA dehydrogenase family protein [Acidimicrobiales bacterium]